MGCSQEKPSKTPADDAPRFWFTAWRDGSNEYVAIGPDHFFTPMYKVHRRPNYLEPIISTTANHFKFNPYSPAPELQRRTLRCIERRYGTIFQKKRIEDYHQKLGRFRDRFPNDIVIENHVGDCRVDWDSFDDWWQRNYNNP